MVELLLIVGVMEVMEEILLRMEAPDPLRGTSFLAEKFLGLLPRTTICPESASIKFILDPSDKWAMTLSFIVKCCCSSRLRPLLAVATRNCNLFHAIGYTEYSASTSEFAAWSKAIDDGSRSTLSSGAGG